VNRCSLVAELTKAQITLTIEEHNGLPDAIARPRERPINGTLRRPISGGERSVKGGCCNRGAVGYKKISLPKAPLGVLTGG
jgi:hypothetical protein